MCAILKGKLKHLFHLIGTWDIYTLHVNWTLGVLVVIFIPVSVHQDRFCGNTLKYAMYTFFPPSGLVMLSSKSACLCTAFALIEHLQI